MQADFFVQAPGGLMAVEAKNQSPTSIVWAQKLRDELPGVYRGQPVSYYAVVTPDTFYFWGKNDAQPAAMSVRESFERYLKDTALDLSRLDYRSFELMVAALLDDLVRGAHVEQLSQELRQSMLQGRILPSELS
jgi:hypothetical protein